MIKSNMEKNWCYTIKEEGHPHNGETLWSGRYCAIAAFIFKTEGIENTYVLANKRGKGTPDFQGLWNCPCGFLEANESAEEGCTRETKEETGVIIPSKEFIFYEVETDPVTSNNGHVTLQYVASIDKTNSIYNIKDLQGGEPNEVDEIKWINIHDLDKYQWAFNHKEIIKNILFNFFHYDVNKRNYIPFAFL